MLLTNTQWLTWSGYSGVYQSFLMTRQDYLIIRTNNPTILIYERYKERHNPAKHGRLMSPQEMLTFLAMWRNPNDILRDIIEELDTQFEVVELLDKHGNLIKLL